MKILPHLQIRVNNDNDIKVKAAILPGDPGRVERVAQYLTDVVPLANHREYRSVMGNYEGISVIVCSTGIGGPSTAIAIEELQSIGVTHMIRVGSCGCLQPFMEVGDLVLVSGAVRDDGTSKSYVEEGFPAIPDHAFLRACEDAARVRQYRYHVGISRSHDHIYHSKKKELDAYWAHYGVLASDMETAALFVAGAVHGIHTASILNAVAPYAGNLKHGVADYAKGEGTAMTGEVHEILTALDAVKGILS